MAISKVQFVQRVSNDRDSSWIGLTTLASAPTPTRGISGNDLQHQHIRLVSRHHSDIPTGGDVILGGFAFAFVAAIICYIRITRRNNNDQS